ncbi:MAG: hypothetical protein RBS58_10670 [Syntrophales bacterium]|nr:hypothetical protein [Syntrophales bacterium]MDX9923090.1 hypothetical protein [Syntrophales bacterium]
MSEHDIAEKIIAEEIGWHHVFEERPPNHLKKLGHKAERQHTFPDLSEPVLACWFSDIYPLVGNGPGSSEDVLLLPLFHYEVEWVIPPPAVFLASIAGDTVMKNKRVLTIIDLYHLLARRVFINVHILTLNEAVPCGTTVTRIYIKF